MRPRLFLDLAAQLAEGTGAAVYRSAISRAYYAVFNAAEEFLERMGFQRPERDYHVVVQRRLLACDDAELRDVGRNLGWLHVDRIRADYRMNDKLCEQQESARKAVKHAAQIASALDGCPIYSQRWKSIRDAIRKVEP